MIYPSAVVFLGTCLVLYTILETSRDRTHVWKNSNLALVYHGIKGIDESTRLQTMHVKSTGKAGKETFVRREGTKLKIA